MLIDFPNYSRSNPWQLKTIQTSSPMPVKLVNSLEHCDCFAIHISWEDILLKSCVTDEQASKVISALDDFLRHQAKKSMIIWTLHNETSHSVSLKDSEALLRAVIMDHAAIIFLMSEKHLFKIPEMHRHKVKINPHYIENSSLGGVPRFPEPTFFRYGEAREETHQRLYLDILKRPEIKKFVSDNRLNSDLDLPCQIVTKRRFTPHEADLYARFANFSTFYRKPKFNSGVINFLIGNRHVVLHDAEAVKYMDLPHPYEKFCIDMDKFDSERIISMIDQLANHSQEIEDFIADRLPVVVSNRFWDTLMSA